MKLVMYEHFHLKLKNCNWNTVSYKLMIWYCNKKINNMHSSLHRPQRRILIEVILYPGNDVYEVLAPTHKTPVFGSRSADLSCNCNSYPFTPRTIFRIVCHMMSSESGRFFWPLDYTFVVLITRQVSGVWVSCEDQSKASFVVLLTGLFIPKPHRLTEVASLLCRSVLSWLIRVFLLIQNYSVLCLFPSPLFVCVATCKNVTK